MWDDICASGIEYSQSVWSLFTINQMLYYYCISYTYFKVMNQLLPIIIVLVKWQWMWSS